MKRFQFRLAKIQHYRRQQLEVEEAKLQAILPERQALDAEATRIETERAQAKTFLMLTGSADAQDLSASEVYLRHLGKQQKRVEAKITEWQMRVDLQRQAVMEAQRCLRLLERLEWKQRREWQADVDREQENLAAELYLARQGRG